MRGRTGALLAVVCSIAAGCTASAGQRNTGIYLLLDTSGTYREQLDKAQHVVNYTLSRLAPNDSFAVARIDTGSFSEKDIVAKTTLADRPSLENLQKRRFSKTVGEFLDHTKSSRYTDISGGLLQAVEYLDEKHPQRKVILIFSDLQEELEKGYVRNVDVSLQGFEVIALNVTKLHSDNVDPRKYLDRLAAWKKRVEAAGGTWRVINDLDGLDGLLIS